MGGFVIRGDKKRRQCDENRRKLSSFVVVGNILQKIFALKIEI